MESMTVTERIFMKLAFARQHFVNNSYTEFYKNRTRGLVTDTVPHTQMDGRTERSDGPSWHDMKSFHFVKKA